MLNLTVLARRERLGMLALIMERTPQKAVRLLTCMLSTAFSSIYLHKLTISMQKTVLSLQYKSYWSLGISMWRLLSQKLMLVISARIVLLDEHYVVKYNVQLL